MIRRNRLIRSDRPQSSNAHSSRHRLTPRFRLVSSPPTLAHSHHPERGLFFRLFSPRLHRGSGPLFDGGILRLGASLGAMSSAYFYPYALSQPLVGLLTDRWGARKVVTLSAFIESGGALLFGLAPTLFLAAVGRGLIGLGAAGVFVPALKVLLPWFGARTFAQMNAVLLAVGNMGAIAASTPFAWLIQKIGWRWSFFLFAGLIFFLGVLSRSYIQDTPAGYASPQENRKPFPPAKRPACPSF